MRENEYQAALIRRLKRRLPGCVVLKNDANLLQGFPDLTILYGERWAVLEVKASGSSPFQANQEYYLTELNKMGYASVIYPEIEQEVLDEIQQALRPRRQSRVPIR